MILIPEVKRRKGRIGKERDHQKLSEMFGGAVRLAMQYNIRLFFKTLS